MLRVLTVAMAVVVTLTACQSMPWKKNQSPPVAELDPVGGTAGTEAPILPEPGLPINLNQRFADVPLPAEVKEDLERTYVYESKTLQIGRMVYTTRASVNELAQFYIREAPVTDWKLDTVLQANGAELLFTKPGKRLHVTIRDLGLRRGRMLVLHLTPQES